MIHRCAYVVWIGLFAAIRTAEGQLPPDDYAYDVPWPKIERLPTVEAPLEGPSPKIERLPPVDAPLKVPIDEPIEEPIEIELDAIDSIIDENADESPPPTASYPWYHPAGWFLREHWEAGFEFGINGAEGNTNALSYRVGANAKRETKRRILALKLYYANGQVDSEVTKNQGQFLARDDWLFPSSPWTVYTKSGLEFDEFRAFDFRLNAAAGLGYRLLKNKRTSLTGRAGSGVSREFGGPEDEYVPEADYGADFSHQFNKRQTITANVDYFPAWTDYNDYRVESNFGWEFELDVEMNLSLKLSIIDRYDSTPNDRLHNDLDYSLLLIWTL